MMRSWFRNWQQRAKFEQQGKLKWGKLIWHIIISPFQWIAMALVWLGKGFVAWWSSRTWRHFLWGLPAFLLVLLCAYFLMFAAATTPLGLAAKYSSAGRAAVQQQKWSAALLYLERAVELGLRDRDSMFQLAVAAEQLKDESRKIAVLQKLAPETHAVYAPAHLWKATQILSAPVVTKELGAEAEKHLKYVIQLDAGNVNAHSILGDLYFQAELWRSAIEHLRFSGQKSFKYRLMLAKASAAAGDVTGARTYAEAVYTSAKETLTETPGDATVRLELGEAALLLERYGEAVKVLEEGISLSDKPEFRQAIALVLVHWSDALLDQSPENRPRSFQLLANALEQNPNELLLFEKILTLLRDQDETATTAETFLKSNIVEGRAVGISHLILGTSYFEKGNVDLAGTHLEQAFRLLPTGLIVANNFAWYLVKSEVPDSDQALKIIDVVIKEDSVRPEFHETRGHVLVARKDWKSAIAEFEYALPRLPPSADTHRGLAESYQGLGLQDLADEHSRLASEIETAEQRGK
jgi:tetratricopeptide (TPR) repeat protein